MRVDSMVAFSSGRISELVTELQLAKPNFLLGVPRVWRRIYDSVNAQLNTSSWVKRTVFNWALAAKLQAQKTGVSTWVDYDNWVFSTVKDKLGGNLRWLVSGAAAADPVISDWLTAVLNVRFVQGYGLSETCAGVCVQHFGGADNFRDSIGCPWTNVTLRLADVPDMDYLTTDVPPRGEILVKSPSIMQGYFKNPTATSTAFDKDGFFCTGDIGLLHSDGSITIIDRKKNLFKLAQGEYVALEYVETICGRAQEVAQVWVWGHPLENFLCAVVVPNWESCESSLRSVAAGGDGSDGTAAGKMTRAQLCQNQGVKKLVLEKMNKAADDAQLPGFQRVKAVVLEPHPWTIESNLLTPTFKVRRNELLKVYHDHLMALISEYKASVPSANNIKQ